MSLFIYTIFNVCCNRYTITINIIYEYIPIHFIYAHIYYLWYRYNHSYIDTYKLFQ